ncbi:MAG: RsmE family RNA methyltransferase [Phycisphaerae bacterium]
MATRRFHCPDLSSPDITVAGDQARHALRVLRLAAGDEVVLFDGRGDEVTGTIRTADRRSFVVRVQARRRSDPASAPRLILAAAVPKGQRADWLIEKCAELGVGTLRLLTCRRGQVVPRPGRIERWQRKAVEAAKQARRAVTMTITPPASLTETLVQILEPRRLWYGDPDERHPWFLSALGCNNGAAAVSYGSAILIGPEGGFTPAECSSIEAAGGTAVRLSDGILRVETAAIAAASLWRTWASTHR